MLLLKPPALVITELCPLKCGEKKLRTVLSISAVRPSASTSLDSREFRVDDVAQLQPVGKLVDEISVGSDRLFIFHLPVLVITAESKLPHGTRTGFYNQKPERNESSQRTLRTRFFHRILGSRVESVFKH